MVRIPAARRGPGRHRDGGARPAGARAFLQRWFRAIARAAGIPDKVWNMDSRAGGAVEADEAGAELGAIQAALTHAKPHQTLRYVRRRSKRIASVADARRRARESDGGTT